MNAKFIVTPGGEELVILPRAEFDRLAAIAAEAAEDEDDVAEFDRAMAARGDAAELGVRESADILIRNGLIRAARKERGLSQQDLAAAVGVAQGFISDVEAGRKRGADETMAAIADALGLPREQLGVSGVVPE